MNERQYFLELCEYRIREESEFGLDSHYCGKTMDSHGLKVYVRPHACAQCRLHGEINDKFLNGMAMQTAKSIIQDTRLGFFRDDQDLAEKAFDVAFGIIKKDPDALAFMKRSMEESVQFGNFEYERAVRIVEKHPEINEE